MGMKMVMSREMEMGRTMEMGREMERDETEIRKEMERAMVNCTLSSIYVAPIRLGEGTLHIKCRSMR
jgi:hypothetical protein